MFAGSKFKNAVSTAYSPAGVLTLPSGSSHATGPSGRTLASATGHVLVTLGDQGSGVLTARPLWDWTKEDGCTVNDRAWGKRPCAEIRLGPAGAHVDLLSLLPTVTVAGGSASDPVVSFATDPHSGLVLSGHSSGRVTVSTVPSGKDLSVDPEAKDPLGALSQLFRSFKSEITCEVDPAVHSSAAVQSVDFHPVATGVVLTGGTDGHARVIDTATGKVLFDMPMGEEGKLGPVLCVKWSRDGKLFAATSCGGRSVRVCDPRAGTVVSEWVAHEGPQAARFEWLTRGGTHLLTTGFSKFRNREIKLWDTTNTDKPLHAISGESSPSGTTPVFDPPSGLVLVSGHADTTVRVMTYDPSKPPYLTDATPFASTTQHKDTCLVPRAALDVMACEVCRVMRVTPAGIEPVTVQVPRKNKRDWADVEELFPEDECVPAGSLSGEEWAAGKDAMPMSRSVRPQPRSAKPQREQDVAPVSAIPPRLTAEALRDGAGASAGSGSGSSGAPGRGSVASVASNSSSRAAALNLVRASKHRNNFPGTVKPELHVYELRPDLQAYPESDSIAISAKGTHYALPWQGPGGLVAISAVETVGRWLDKNSFVYETGLGTVCDLAFSPLAGKTELALGTDTGTVAIIGVDLDKVGTNADVVTSRTDLAGHEARITRVRYHPSVPHVLATASAARFVRIWDTAAGKELNSFDHGTDMVFDVDWSTDGNQIVTTARDGVVRVWDVRSESSTPVMEFTGHEGQRTSRVIWLGGEKATFATTGFSKGSDRQIKLYDMRSGDKTAYATINVDVNSGPLMPFYDDDGGLLYVCGKGSGWIRCYELVTEKPFAHQVSDHSAASAYSGLAHFPRSVVDVSAVEVARFLRLSKDRLEPVSFFTPRTRKEYFQDDIYTNGIPDISAPVCGSPEEFWRDGPGKSYALPRKTLRPDGMGLLSEAPPPPQAVRAEDKFAKDMAADERNADAEKLFDTFAEKIKLGSTVKGSDTGADHDGVDEDEWSD